MCGFPYPTPHSDAEILITAEILLLLPQNGHTDVPLPTIPNPWQLLTYSPFL